MLWQKQFIATILAAMVDDEFGEIIVELVPQCFVAGTPVATEAGLKPIEKIRTGDKLRAWNEVTDEVTLRPVVNRFIHRRREVFEIKVGRDTFKVTGEHLFYVAAKGWTLARDVQDGDQFVTSENCVLAVGTIKKRDGEVLVGLLHPVAPVPPAHTNCFVLCTTPLGLSTSFVRRENPSCVNSLRWLPVTTATACGQLRLKTEKERAAKMA